ncbi:MAG: response regulator transcription factor [Synergistaceae bacterium]
MSISIIIADDHPLTREGMKAYLEKETDFQIVGEFANGLDAWEAIEKLKPQIALLDVRMPEIDGVTLARKIKDAKLSTSAIMLTSYDSQQYVMASLRSGARGYLLKTSDMSLFAKAIRAVAKGGFYLDNNISNIIENKEEFIPEPLSVREREVLLFAAKGLSGKEIAIELFISERTVQTHLASIYDKLGAKNKTEAMLLALKYGIATLEELLD